jgi:site-specific DNA-methyltransferase (adenine-specific)
MKNQLFYGDNLEILRNFIQDESVDLCYIDPPFNSDENYNQTYSTKDNKDFAQSQAFLDTWTWGESAKIAFEEIKKNVRCQLSL